MLRKGLNLLKFQARRRSNLFAGILGAAIITPLAITNYLANSQEIEDDEMDFFGGGDPTTTKFNDPKIKGKHFDIAVIGGGSGGLALALEAKKLGLNPIVFDYVEASLQ